MSEAFFGLPADVEFCSRCVISNQRPSSTVEFKHVANERKSTISMKDGVCDACRYHDTKEVGIDWNKREEQLIQLCDRYRRPSGYDVIVPGSGGKDSAYTAHILKYKYGMNPLTVTWAPHLYTDIGWRNFTNWIHVGGLDNILFTPNGRLHRLLTKLAFTNLLHPFQPFIVGQRIIGPLMARRFTQPSLQTAQMLQVLGISILQAMSIVAISLVLPWVRLNRYTFLPSLNLASSQARPKLEYRLHVVRAIMLLQHLVLVPKLAILSFHLVLAVLHLLFLRPARMIHQEKLQVLPTLPEISYHLLAP